MKASVFNKNFIKDLKLPIAVDKEPYFEYYLELINPYYDSIKKYEIFKNDFNNHGKEFFFENNKKLVQNVINFISESKEYKLINEMDINIFNKEINIPSKELYKTENASKRFFSIDLVKANFQSLLFVQPTIFGGYTDYSKFAIEHGFNEYMLISKLTRQILFGNLNPKRQQKIQSFMMNQIVSKLVENDVDLNSIYSLSSDELIFEQKEHQSNDILNIIKPLDYNVRVESFTLLKPFNKPFFVKQMDNGNVEFKMVTTSIMAEFIKRFENRKVEDIDLYFYDENKRLSRFIEPTID